MTPNMSLDPNVICSRWCAHFFSLFWFHRSMLFTREEVATHNKENDLWIVIGNNVLNVTGYGDAHPGGLGTLLSFAGKDATTAFNAVGHPDSALQVLSRFIVGSIVSEEKLPGKIEKVIPGSGKKMSKSRLPKHLLAVVVGAAAVVVGGGMLYVLKRRR